jgi:hypothetical protein
MPRARLQGGEQFELAQAVEEKCHHDFESRQEGTGQISGESEGKRRWNEHRGCKPSSSEAGEVSP